MIGEIIQCQRNDCEDMFTKKTHNQRYHNDECCRLATNFRIMEKYYDKRDQRSGRARYCKICGNTKLSRYNDSQICSSCDIETQGSINKSLAEMLSSVTWQT